MNLLKLPVGQLITIEGKGLFKFNEVDENGQFVATKVSKKTGKELKEKRIIWTYTKFKKV
jgi:hypothetical protein